MAENCSVHRGKHLKRQALCRARAFGPNVAQVEPGIYTFKIPWWRRASAHGVSESGFDKTSSKTPTVAPGTQESLRVHRFPSRGDDVHVTGRHRHGDLESQPRVEHRWLQALVRHSERRLHDRRGCRERYQLAGHTRRSPALLLRSAGLQHFESSESVFSRNLL